MWWIKKEKMNLSTSFKQGTITELGDDYLLIWVEAFLIDRKAQNMAVGTLDFYRKKLKLFTDYCEGQAVNHVFQITPSFLREFLIELEVNGHNSGGIHAIYRSVRAFLRWFENELEPENWKNPITKVKPPIVNIEPITPVTTGDVSKMVNVCKNDLLGKRDKAILLFLLDTGVRASELLSVQFEDIDLIIGDVLIRYGKGRKHRIVFLGKKSRRALRAYVRMRHGFCQPFWITRNGEQLSYWGLRQIVRRKAELANIPIPSLHDFRRAFALECLRNGADIYSLQKLMGHADLQVLRRYLAQTTNDIREVHERSSPVDNFLD
jgi:site-specific recombinase XerD